MTSRVVEMMKNDIGAPFDYSWRELNSMNELVEEVEYEREEDAKIEQEKRDKKKAEEKKKHPLTQQDDDDDEKKKVEEPPLLPVHKSNAIKMNNNTIKSMVGLPTAIATITENPEILQWLDFSFNEIEEIDDCILDYQTLTTLYLHNNNISDIKTVDKLRELPKLKSLTLYSNPIEDIPNYRLTVLFKIPQLIQLDFSPVTRQERVTVQTQSQWIIKKEKKKRAKKEDDD